MALTQGALETGAVLAGLAVGAAYSLPPLRLKRFPLVASLCITGVRAVVVNLGVALHFTGGGVPAGVWALTLFVLPFAFAIAVLKDVPDLEGDRATSIRTFTVRIGGRAVLRMGLAALAVAYLGMADPRPAPARGRAAGRARRHAPARARRARCARGCAPTRPTPRTSRAST